MQKTPPQYGPASRTPAIISMIIAAFVLVAVLGGAILLGGMPQSASGQTVIQADCPLQMTTSAAPARLKLQAIFSGPDGQAAVINGRPIQLGQEINGAVLESIDANSVTLVAGGRHLTLGL